MELTYYETSQRRNGVYYEGLPSIWSSQGLAEQCYYGLSSCDRKLRRGYGGLGSVKSMFVCVANKSCGEVFSATHILFCFASYFVCCIGAGAALCC